ncbi:MULTISPECIES: hypothetical protein [Citrobacter]|uniref:hypothetical protein n=1 Tax=Citrobacter TaxID=544 RepID=UPI0018FFE267|nr:hypothetical protein [Citrobacter freundii]MBJ9155393.1 hypothetical protein [Citrobacter freundii]HAU5664874.1 hypothetical protein [Citrobacter freundii]HDQ2971795.1 hypothetical protein [Citrobacter freundii]HEG1963432.1 hypothetical protein [Citrobacter freundii]
MESKPSLFSADIYSPQWIVNPANRFCSPQWIVNPANRFCSPQWIANSEGSNDNHYREWI